MKYLFLCLLLPLLSCTSKTPIPADTLIIGIEAQPKTLDPRFATDAVGMNLSDLLFISLVRWNNNLELIGDAAESWTYKDKTYTFKLRANLQFTDGSPITPQDIKFSFNEYMKPSSPFKSSFDKISNIRVDYNQEGGTLELQLSEFSAALLADLTVLKILPKSVVEKFKFDYAQNLVGSGAFALKSINENEILLQAIPRFYRQPNMQKVIFKVVRDDTSRFQRMYKGSLDVVQSDMPLSKVKIFKNSPRFQVFESAGLSMTYLLLNLDDSILKNQQVRQAMNIAINRSEIIKHKMEGYGRPATTIMTPVTPYYDHDLQPASYDLEKAQAILPKEFQGTKLVLKSSNQAAAIDKANLIAYQLEKLGFQVSVKSYEWGTYYGDIKNGNFQLATMRWVGIADPDIYRLAFHSKQLPPLGRNRGRYKNKKLDVLLEKGLLIEDHQKRIKHYKKVQKILFNDLPIIPLWYDNLVSIVNKRIKNYHLTPNGNFNFVFDVEKRTHE